MKCLTRVCSRPSYGRVAPAIGRNLVERKKVGSLLYEEGLPGVRALDQLELESLHVARAYAGVGDRVRAGRWLGVVGPAVECPAGQVLSCPAPLLEEECDTRRQALVADAADPLRAHRPGAGAALPADDHPGDPGQIDCSQVLQQRLDGQEPDRGRGGAEMVDSWKPVLAVLDTDPPPDMRLIGEVA